MAWDLKIRGCHASVAFGPDDHRRAVEFNKLIAAYTADKSKKCLQIGVYHAMGSKNGDNWISLDPYDKRDCIDYREKLEETTLPSDTFDLIVCNAILEHVEDPWGCVRQLYRICKPGGKVWCEIPFVQPFHPYKTWELEHGMFGKVGEMTGDTDHGGDYWRFTPQGLLLIMKPFKLIEMMLVNDGGIMFYGEK